MINFDFSKECYSCSACANVCNKGAIQFDRNLIPWIDRTLCVDCGKCERVCIKINETSYLPQLKESVSGYVCKNDNLEERMASSSGGIFVLLAKEILTRKGYICGCVYDTDFMPKHILTNKLSDVHRMMGSKYIKSDMGNCIREMEAVLKRGADVLFSGVPCQTAAVKACLGKYSNLYLINVICHGSIEREFWMSYLNEERKNGIITDLTMRDKTKGWSNYGLRVQFEDGTEHTTFRGQDGYFLQCFTEGLFERDRCLKCNYKGTNIVGDMLLGDGWGMDQVFPDFYDSIGLSSVLLLSYKGDALFQKIEDAIHKRTIAPTEIVSRNQRIVSPAPRSPLLSGFQHKCRKFPEKINSICEKYAKPTIINRLVKQLLR